MHPSLSAAFDGLDSSRAALRAAVDIVPPPMRETAPAPGRWSAAGVLEHLAMAERGFASWIIDAVAAADPAALGPEIATPEGLPVPVRDRMADRANRREAREAVQPTGTKGLEDAWSEVTANEDRLRGSLAAAGDLALSKVLVQHPALGAFNVYQWLELIASHRLRHVEQIREIAAAT